MVGVASGARSFDMPEWLPIDAEESVLGVQWHQEAADALAGMLEEVARRHEAPWGVRRNIALLASGGRYLDGHPYDPRPDVMVLAQPLPWGGLAGICLAEAGVPLFVAEVASKSTFGNDVGPKRGLYEAIGVPEYIVFDAVGEVLSSPLLAWRLEQGRTAYSLWGPEDDGWWKSRSLDAAFRPAQPYLAIRDREGEHVLLPRDAQAQATLLARELAEARRRLMALEQRVLRDD